MKPIDQIRQEIASLEARIDKLRSVEDVLSTLEGGKALRRGRRAATPEKILPKAAAKPAAKTATKAPVTKAPSGVREGSIGEAVLDLLKAQGALPRADIENAIRSDRDVGKQSISVSLQRLRKAGKVTLKDNQWALKKR
ncbi:hypothetical protein [Beijerinckia indica]|uniref:Uncharacterized protein n=1 Tax=Beijerinckia indica subsp. indica (strain ATCC 9039 / DSM 1715 / NCIMB 8712) TaxID=395963 RepID=B2IJI1_BEII9|nr:hypothetical protein [Beijerinckia indica]ACB96294.1 hypothetical protein Bind_2722 [Beijerinckia indica subsp. indica ATCC 9039]